MTVTTDERAALSDLFQALGPAAPTLLEGWATADLLAHLLVRERRPDAAGGILLPALAKRTERVMAQMLRTTPFPVMVTTFRSGPPLWSPWAIPVLGDRGNAVEFYVHHEDVRRAQPNWQPRPSEQPREDALWRALKLMGRVLYRKSPVGVVLQSTGRDDVQAHRGTRSVTVVGLPSEIILHAFGRHPDVVRVVVQGDAADVDALASSPRGF
ncbi:MAG: TIGR03085 family metal-binding protein [Ilumatobacteraceae bacterium]